MPGTVYGDQVFKGQLSAPGLGTQTEKFGANATTSTAIEACVFGYGASAAGDRSTAFGYGSRAPNEGGTAVGHSANVIDLGVALGWGASVSMVGGVALGKSAQVTHNRAVAIGIESQTTADDTATIGRVGGASTQKKALQVSNGFAAFGGTPPASQPAHVPDPAGGVIVDAESRAAINAILVILENAGLVASA